MRRIPLGCDAVPALEQMLSSDAVGKPHFYMWGRTSGLEGQYFSSAIK